MAAPRYGRIEGARFHLCENKLCFARFKKASKMIKKVSVTNAEGKE